MSPQQPQLRNIRPGFVPGSNSVVFAVTSDNRLVTFAINSGRELQSLRLPAFVHMDELSISPSGETFALIVDCQLMIASWTGLSNVLGDKKNCVQGTPIWRSPGAVTIWLSADSGSSERVIKFLDYEIGLARATVANNIPKDFFPDARLADGTLIGTYSLPDDTGENLGLARLGSVRSGATSWRPLFSWGERTGILEHSLLPASANGSVVVAARGTDYPVGIEIMLIRRTKGRPEMCWNLPNSAGLPRELPNLSSDGSMLIYLEAPNRSNAAKSSRPWALRHFRIDQVPLNEWKQCPLPLTRYRGGGAIR